MRALVAEALPVRDLEALLDRRRAMEAICSNGHPERPGAFLLRHDRVVAPLLKAALQITGLYSIGVRNARRPVLRRLRFEFPDLPASLDGFRILHLADLHIDGMGGLAEAVADRVAAIPVDLCVMTGDYRFRETGPCDGIYPRLQVILSRVQARHGVIGILGNHDAADMALELEQRGVRMLINEAVPIRKGRGELWVIGVDDPHYYGCDDLEAALDEVPSDAFKILLAHTPGMFEEASAAGIHLYLCGHTHAGQICLPWIGPLLSNARCPRAYARGAWRHAGMHGYTSAGVGCSMLPVRYNCPPEISLIELVRQPLLDVDAAANGVLQPLI